MIVKRNDVIEPSKVTKLLIERDASGQAKYGATLDRTDLSIEDWLQHAVEESLDQAGYMLAAKREIAKLREELLDLKNLASTVATGYRGSIYASSPRDERQTVKLIYETREMATNAQDALGFLLERSVSRTDTTGSDNAGNSQSGPTP